MSESAWTWARVDPEHYVAPSSVFDSLGVTTYFGGEVITKTALRQELLAKIAEGMPVEGMESLAPVLTDSMVSFAEYLPTDALVLLLSPEKSAARAASRVPGVTPAALVGLLKFVRRHAA